MYIVVVEDNLKIRNANIYDNLLGVRFALKKYRPEYGFSVMIFVLDPEEGLYVEINPEDLDYYEQK